MRNHFVRKGVFVGQPFRVAYTYFRKAEALPYGITKIYLIFLVAFFGLMHKIDKRS